MRLLADLDNLDAAEERNEIKRYLYKMEAFRANHSSYHYWSVDFYSGSRLQNRVDCASWGWTFDTDCVSGHNFKHTNNDDDRKQH